jgi:hypothetical protein
MGTMLDFSLSQRLSQRQRLSVSGGATETVFPQVERWLEEVDHLRSLRAVAHRAPRALDYRSLVDLLLCEACPEHRPACRAFYDGEGPRLSEVAGPRALASAEARLLSFLALAHDAWRREESVRWGDVATAADVAAMMAA